jgi:hypothetical protein
MVSSALQPHQSEIAMTYHFRAFLIGVVLLASVVLACTIAHAGEATVSWEHATTNTDGSPIGTIVRTEINYGLCNVDKTLLMPTPAPVILQIPYPTNERVITALPTGTWCFQARTYTDTYSDWTPFVWKDIIDKPNPPSLSVR